MANEDINELISNSWSYRSGANLVEHGKVTFDVHSGTTIEHINFAKTFSSIPNIFITPNHEFASNTTNASQMTILYRNVTTSGFDIVILNAGSWNAEWNFSWMAIL